MLGSLRLHQGVVYVASEKNDGAKWFKELEHIRNVCTHADKQYSCSNMNSRTFGFRLVYQFIPLRQIKLGSRIRSTYGWSDR